MTISYKSDIAVWSVIATGLAHCPSPDDLPVGSVAQGPVCSSPERS
jgi:hypothetical protein